LTNLQFLSGLIIVAGKSRQFLFQFGLGRSQVDVDGAQFVDAVSSFLSRLFGSALGPQSL
jgi:hypothetical protein